MAVEAQPRPLVTRPSSANTLRQIFAPIGQIFLFVLGSVVLLGAIVLLIGFILSRTDATMLNKVFNLLPFVIIDGLVIGFLYATIALGYTMVYGVLEFINFAHGEIFMVGGFVAGGLAIFFQSQGWLAAFLPADGAGTLGQLKPLLFVVLAVIIGSAVSGGLAMSIERVAYRPLRNAPRLVPLIAALGMSLVLQDVVRMIAGQQRFNLTFPDLGLNKRFQFFQIETGTGSRLNVSIDSKSLIFIIVSLIMLVALNYLVNATKLGKAIRAVAQDRPTASLMGINVNQVIALTFLIGGALGGAAGVLFGIKVNTINPYIGFLPGLKAFTAAVLGGIGNITGAMVGGIVLGLLESFVAGYLSLFTRGNFGGADYASVAAFLILIGILIFKPSGLLGEATTQKV